MLRHDLGKRQSEGARAAAPAFLLFVLFAAAAAASPAGLGLWRRAQTAGRSGIGRPSQSAQGQSIRGTITNSSGAILAGARVTLTRDADHLRRMTVTGSDGEYSFPALTPGNYTLKVQSAGCKRAIRSNLRLGASNSLIVDFSLVRASGRKMAASASSRRHEQANGNQAALGDFHYYDQPQFRAGGLSGSPDAGGYSSSSRADSYDLILSYVESEHPAPNLMAMPGSSSRARPAQPSSLAWAENFSKGWNEREFFSQGSDLLLHGDYARAEYIFQAGVARFPDSGKLQTGLGVALYSAGAFEPAVSTLIRAADLMPSDPRPYLLLGKANAALTSKNPEVEKRLKRLIELDPRSAPARYYYALSLWKSAASGGPVPAEVETWLRSAIALDPKFADAHLALGALFAQHSKYPSAIAEYQACIRLEPKLAAPHYRLAQAYARAGEKAAAEAEIKLYERLRKTHP